MSNDTKNKTHITMTFYRLDKKMDSRTKRWSYGMRSSH